MSLRILILIALIFSVPNSLSYGSDLRVYNLAECIDIALKQSPLVKFAQFDVDASQQLLNGSKGAHYPKLDLNASFMKENRPIPYIQAESATVPAITSQNIYAWAVAVRMPIYEGGRLSKQVKISEIESSIQTSRKDFVRQDVVGNVTNAFNKVLQLKNLRTANLKSVEALERQRKNSELLIQAGRLPKVELLKIEVQLAVEKQNLIRTEEAISRAKYNLAYFMGVAPQDVADVSGSLNNAEKIELEKIEILLKNRPDVLASSLKVEQAKARIDYVSGKRFPSIAAVGNYGTRSGSQFNDGKTVWEAGVVASINLFDAGVISSDIAREKTLQNKAEEELRQTQLKARLEVDSALSFLREAEAKLTVSEKAIASAQESARIEELKYKTGTGTVTDALLAESAHSLSQANYYQALYDYNTAVIEIKRATGAIEVNK